MKHHMGKKLLSALVAAGMTLCSVSAFASPKDDFIELSGQEVTKAAFTYDFGFQMDEPLSATLDPNGEMSAVLDGLQFHTYGKMDMSDDYKQMKMEMTMDMPEIVSAVPDAPESMDMWIDMDLSDTENPKMMVILEDPISGQYGYMDYTAIDGMLESYASIFDVNKIQQMNQQLMESVDLPEEAFAETDNGYTLTMTGEQLMDGMEAMMQVMSGYIMSAFSAPALQGGADPAEFTAAAAQLKETLSGVQLFGDPALVLEYQVDENKLPTAMNMVLSIDTNITDIAVAFGASAENLPAREDANLKMSFTASMAFTNVGEEQNIVIPELTEENSINLLQPQLVEYDMNAINVVFNGQPVVFPDAQPILENDRTFVPVRAVSNVFGIPDEDITWQDGVVTIKSGDKVITLTEGVQEITIAVNGEETKSTLDVAPFNREDRVYVPLRFINEALGGATAWEPLYANGEGSPATGSIVTLTLIAETQQDMRVLLPESDTALKTAVEAASSAANVPCEVVVGEDDTYTEKLNLILAANDPTVLYVPFSAMDGLTSFFDEHSADILVDLTDVVDTGSLDETVKTAITGADGKIYGYPVGDGAFFIMNSVDSAADAIALVQAIELQ